MRLISRAVILSLILAPLAVEAQLTGKVWRAHPERRTAMRKQTVVSLMLGAILLAGCATHRNPVAADGRAPATDDEVGAIVADIWYAPGRALLCGGTAIIAGAVMTVTLGQSYESASELMHGGCSRPWIVRPADIRQAVP